MDLNAEEVEEEVGTMWRTMHKLSRTFAERPNPKRSAEITKAKLDRFKTHMPLLQTFCNPGIRDRHWERVSDTCLLNRACAFEEYIHDGSPSLSSCLTFTCKHTCTHIHTNTFTCSLKMSAIVGFNLKPNPTTPLSTMIDYGLHKHIEK